MRNRFGMETGCEMYDSPVKEDLGSKIYAGIGYLVIVTPAAVVETGVRMVLGAIEIHQNPSSTYPDNFSRLVQATFPELNLKYQRFVESLDERR